MRKLINDPFDCVDEMLAGLLVAVPHGLGVTGSGRGLVFQRPDPRRRVRVVTGGGSGHEPAFIGWLGSGLADGVAVGNIFAAPSAEPVLEIAERLEPQNGLIMVFGNYDGDIMNFGMAAELLSDQGIESRTVLVTDDVVSAADPADRRGIAGGLVVVKAAGAKADEGGSLDEVFAAAVLANSRTRSISVALGPCTVPTAGFPTFELPEGQMEIGMGVHGERGQGRRPLGCADEVADQMLSTLLEDGAGSAGEPVLLLVNSLGATPLMESLIVLRRLAERIRAAGIQIRQALVGEYETSLEMAGISVTVTDLDPELERLIAAPAVPLIGAGFGSQP